MLRKIFIISVIVASVQYCHAQRWKRIAKDISKQQISYSFGDEQPTDEELSIYFHIYDYYRRRLDVSPLEINFDNDTLYILEVYGDYSDFANGCTMFTRRGILSYSVDLYVGNVRKLKKRFKKSYLETDSMPYGPIYMLKLAAKWDIRGLKNEVEKNGNGMIPQCNILLTRVIFRHGSYTIDCAEFGDFFSLERDLNDSYFYGNLDQEAILKMIFE